MTVPLINSIPTEGWEDSRGAETKQTEESLRKEPEPHQTTEALKPHGKASEDEHRCRRYPPSSNRVLLIIPSTPSHIFCLKTEPTLHTLEAACGQLRGGPLNAVLCLVYTLEAWCGVWMRI